MAKSSAGKSSLKRAVRVLEAFDSGVRDLSVSEICRKTGMPLSTAHALAGQLVEVGLLERLPSRRYRIGLHMWELAVRTPGAVGMREIATPYLRTVLATLGHHVQLGILQEGEVLYLERLSGPRAVVIRSAVGTRFPLNATSSGLILAAFGEEPLRERMRELAGTPPRYAPSMTPDEMTARLDQVREDGYATTEGYIELEATSIAVPILAPNGLAVAALASIVPTESYDQKRVVAVLRPAARAISDALQARYFG